MAKLPRRHSKFLTFFSQILPNKNGCKTGRHNMTRRNTSFWKEKKPSGTFFGNLFRFCSAPIQNKLAEAKYCLCFNIFSVGKVFIARSRVDNWSKLASTTQAEDQTEFPLLPLFKTGFELMANCFPSAADLIKAYFVWLELLRILGTWRTLECHRYICQWLNNWL